MLPHLIGSVFFQKKKQPIVIDVRTASLQPLLSSALSILTSLLRVPGHQEESEAANRARQEVHSALCRCWQLQHVALRKFQIFRRKERRKFGRCRGTDDQVFARKAQEHTGACLAPLRALVAGSVSRRPTLPGAQHQDQRFNCYPNIH